MITMLIINKYLFIKNKKSKDDWFYFLKLYILYNESYYKYKNIKKSLIILIFIKKKLLSLKKARAIQIALFKLEGG